MKIESLAIIFLIIIIPIMTVMSEYIDKKLDTARLETEYNTRLLNATQDAINAYQISTVTDTFSDVTNSKIKDIQASSYIFMTSLASNFNYVGFSANSMKQYIPALVYTLYDGYYIYSPFNNTLTEVGDNDNDDSYSKDGETLEGLKPYVYYSCKYKPDNTSDDFVITYTLDNYITIQGEINGQYIYDYGFLYSIADTRYDTTGIYYNADNNSYIFDGIEFTENDTEKMKENVGDTQYYYVKINGKKYYLDENAYPERDEIVTTSKGETFKASTGIFYIDSDGSKEYSQVLGYKRSEPETQKDNKKFLQYYRAINNNKSAYEYYKNAYEFSKAVLDTPVIGYKDKTGTEINGGYKFKDLKYKDAEFYNINNSGVTPFSTYGNEDTNIFVNDNGEGIRIQNEASEFNKHRRAIIRYIVESNLTTAITSYKDMTNSNIEYIMPKISDTDWEVIQNESCAISFLQGMSIGTKRFNGYKVVPNAFTKEHIDELDIYIINKNNTYCRANDENIENNVKTKDEMDGFYAGIWKLDFKHKKVETDDNNLKYYVPQLYYGSYSSIMGNTAINYLENNDMYEYINKSGDVLLKKTYYMALGRERWGSFNINNINFEEYLNVQNEYFLKDY